MIVDVFLKTIRAIPHVGVALILSYVLVVPNGRIRASIPLVGIAIVNIVEFELVFGAIRFSLFRHSNSSFYSL